MSAFSTIEWTDRTWNPVRGCSVISTGCVNCYAMKFAHRFSAPGKPYEGLTKQTKAGPQWTGQVRTVDAALLEPLSWRKPARVFVNSMSDLFHEGVPGAFIDRVFAVMALAPRHTFQVLTKRPERMRAYLTGAESRVRDAVAFDSDDPRSMRAAVDAGGVWTPPQVDGLGRVELLGYFDGARFAWPLPNVWLGVSVEDQARADERIPPLLQTPAAVRFISAEPLLGPLTILREWRGLGHRFAPQADDDAVCCCGRPHAYHVGLDWVIVGGESGPGARPCDVQWMRSIVQQCRAVSVPVFVKQAGAVPVTQCGQCGRTVGRVRGGFVDACGPSHAALIAEHIGIRNAKGGDPSEWPADLHVREFPAVEAHP